MILNSTDKITSFGGIHLVDKHIKASKIIKLINKEFSRRGDYRYSDLLLSRIYSCFCGATSTEDVNYLRESFISLSDFDLPSADTILRMERELSSELEVTINDKGVTNEINVNTRLNDLLSQIIVKTNVLSTKKGYCMDFDHQFLANQKRDSSLGYKKEKGYFPGVASINNTPLYIENRNGNSSVKYNQLATLKATFNQADKFDIKIDKCRMDSGSYIKEVCEFLDTKCSFYIRAEKSTNMLFEASLIEEWEDVEINYIACQATSMDWKFGKNTYRLICQRKPNKTGQISAITSDAYSYSFILTNQTKISPKEAIEFYNQRGASEKLFDVLNNDFNWKSMPHSKLEHNTVYLIIMAICKVIYQWILNVFSKETEMISIKDRLKKIIFRIICIPAKVIKTGRRNVVKLFTKHLPTNLLIT